MNWFLDKQTFLAQDTCHYLVRFVVVIDHTFYGKVVESHPKLHHPQDCVQYLPEMGKLLQWKYLLHNKNWFSFVYCLIAKYYEQKIHPILESMIWTNCEISVKSTTKSSANDTFERTMSISTVNMFLLFTYRFTTNVANITKALVDARSKAMERVIAGRHSNRVKNEHQFWKGECITNE